MFSLALKATTISCESPRPPSVYKGERDERARGTHGFQEFRNVDLIVETLSPPSLENEISCQSLSGCRFEWSKLNSLVERVTYGTRRFVSESTEEDMRG